MITTAIIIITILITVIFFLNEKYRPIKVNDGRIRFNFKTLFTPIILVIIAFVQPFSVERIDAGSVGLKENLLGSDRGIDDVTQVSGYVIYNSYTTRIHEIQLDQKTVHYKPFKIIVKGGLECVISPSFNFKVKPESAPDLFIELRQTFKQGGLDAVKNGWMTTIVQSSINNVGNRFEVDSIFNYRENFDGAIRKETTGKLSKWFEIDEFKSNIVPPPSLQTTIESKIKSIQEAQAYELDALKAASKAKELKATAQGAFDAEIINNKTKQLKAQPAVLEVFKAETDRIWAEKGVSRFGTGNVFGSASGIILQK